MDQYTNWRNHCASSGSRKSHEHNLICTCLYAAFSLKDSSEGLNAEQAEAVARWRKSIIHVAVEEVSHLLAIWNISSALGGTPSVGRWNFPLDPGILPAGIVVKDAAAELAAQPALHGCKKL